MQRAVPACWRAGPEVERAGAAIGSPGSTGEVPRARDAVDAPRERLGFRGFRAALEVEAAEAAAAAERDQAPAAT